MIVTYQNENYWLNMNEASFDTMKEDRPNQVIELNERGSSYYSVKMEVSIKDVESANKKE